MKTLLALALLALPLCSQQGTPVRVTDDPSPTSVQKVFVISGTNTVAICTSPSFWDRRANTAVAIGSVSKANPAVVTSTAHGFDTNSLPKVTIAGATGTGWTAINGTFVITVIDANTFSIAVDSTGFGTLAGTVTFTTLGPRKTVPEWSVQKFAYDASGNAIWSGWLYGSSAYNFKCSEAATAGIQAQ